MCDDYNLLIFHRYQEEGEGSVSVAIRSSANPVLASGLTSLMGYFGLLFVEHPGIRSLGLLAVVGIAVSLLTALVLFPVILGSLERIPSLKKDIRSLEITSR